MNVRFTSEHVIAAAVGSIARLEQIAETLSSDESSVGRRLQVCERWIYSAVLCFAVRAVAESVLALSPMARGFSASDVAAQVRARFGDEKYVTSRAAYDLRKLRGKGLVSKLPQSRRYSACPQALRALAALVIMREHVIRPLLAGALHMQVISKPRHLAPLDRQYRYLRRGMNDLLREVGIAA
jgi:hypothetical protein